MPDQVSERSCSRVSIAGNSKNVCHLNGGGATRMRVGASLEEHRHDRRRLAKGGGRQCRLSTVVDTSRVAATLEQGGDCARVVVVRREDQQAVALVVRQVDGQPCIDLCSEAGRVTVPSEVEHPVRVLEGRCVQTAVVVHHREDTLTRPAAVRTSPSRRLVTPSKRLRGGGLGQARLFGCR